VLRALLILGMLDTKPTPRRAAAVDIQPQLQHERGANRLPVLQLHPARVREFGKPQFAVVLVKDVPPQFATDAIAPSHPHALETLQKGSARRTP